MRLERLLSPLGNVGKPNGGTPPASVPCIGIPQKKGGPWVPQHPNTQYSPLLCRSSRRKGQAIKILEAPLIEIASR